MHAALTVLWVASQDREKPGEADEGLAEEAWAADDAKAELATTASAAAAVKAARTPRGHADSGDNTCSLPGDAGPATAVGAWVVTTVLQPGPRARIELSSPDSNRRRKCTQYPTNS
jgi:hypothetical protein